MNNLINFPSWQALELHFQQIAPLLMKDMFHDNPERFAKFHITAASLLLDYSKNRINAQTIALLCQLAHEAGLSEKIEQLFSGYPVNSSENRAALHTALRQQDDTPVYVNGNNIITEIRATQKKMQELTIAIHQQRWRGYSNLPITDIINIGVGGSDLGPAMVTLALKPYTLSQLRCHFVSNLDGAHISETLAALNPASTLIIISSKSFTTQETLLNAAVAKEWLLQAFKHNTAALSQHLLAVTAKPTQALAFGIPADNIFLLWDWVGGRYSLWSAVGLPIALAVGYDNFTQLLLGAAAMDQHFRTAPFAQNMPVLLALLGIWYVNFFHCQSQAILPYHQYLQLLPTYLQQAQMESCGKSIQHNGTAVSYATSPVLWGGIGTNSQHAFHQLFYQGTPLVPVDFIVTASAHHPLQQHQALLFANCLSQSRALMQGKTAQEILLELQAEGYSADVAAQLAYHKTIAGNRPSNTLVLKKLTPYSLGALIALYEHKIFTQSVIWGINCFDQWGVELGKQLATEIVRDLQTNQHDSHDASTLGLMAYYQNICE